MFRLLFVIPLLVANARAFSPEDLQLSAEARGVLAHSCTKCHGQQKQKGGLRLDTRDSAMKGGDEGAVLVLRRNELHAPFRHADGMHLCTHAGAR